MLLRRTLQTIFLGLSACSLQAQKIPTYGKQHFTSTHTSFPDTGRSQGYIYDSVQYTASAHYQDSSVLLIIPPHLDRHKKVDLVFWFHGWRNNIDTALEFYKLGRQFLASGRNAILVLAETARNAPDSYGGKLEQPAMFKALVYDVMEALKGKGVVPKTAAPGNIVLAGHSGAFRVIACMLQNGQVPVQEVILFDALYSQLEKFENWINEDPSHHFVHWYTNQGGGTDEMSDIMMKQLKEIHHEYLLAEERNITPEMIRNNRILFVHSLREHNVIINDPDNFRLLLENSFILQPVSTSP